MGEYIKDHNSVCDENFSHVSPQCNILVAADGPAQGCDPPPDIPRIECAALRNTVFAAPCRHDAGSDPSGAIKAMNLKSVKMPTFTFLPDIDGLIGIREDAAAPRSRAGSPAGSAAGGRLATVLAYVASLPRRRRETAELSSFSDRELADISLSRGDIARIHDPKFAADYAERHNAVSHPAKA
jgi:uncharacterized protein YjiS (DUF1127 family)